MILCPRCKTSKDESMFFKDKSRKSGYKSWCKVCSTEKRKAWVEQNKETLRAYDRARRKTVEQKRKRNERRREIHALDPSKTRDRTNRWNSLNPDRIKEYHHNRYVKEKSRVGNLPRGWRAALINLAENKCMKCGFEETLTVDHVVPVSNGGLHCISNMQILCKSCNCSKRNFSSDDYRTNEFILGIKHLIELGI
jgi:5-methylcytosine-specific restriction endonuclease McrA